MVILVKVPPSFRDVKSESILAYIKYNVISWSLVKGLQWVADSLLGIGEKQ